MDWGDNDPVAGAPAAPPAAPGNHDPNVLTLSDLITGRKRGEPFPDKPSAAPDVPAWGADDKPVQSTTDKVKAALGATSAQDYGQGAGYLIDNPLTRGLAQAGNTAATGLNETLRRVFINPADAAINAMGGHSDLSGDFTRNAIAPAVATNAQLVAPANAGIGSDVVQNVAALGGSVATAMAGGGAGEAVPLAANAAPTITEMMASGAMSPATRTAATLGTTSAGAQAAQLDANGQPVSNAQFGNMALADTEGNLLPMGHGLPLLARPIAGAAAGVGGRALSDAATGNQSTLADYLTAAATGGTLGTIFGGKGKTPEAKPSKTADFGDKDPVVAQPPAPTQMPVADQVASNATQAGLAADDVAAHTAAADAMVQADPQAEVPLHPATPIDATTSAPLGGGGSKDNTVNYVDKRIPQLIDVPNSKGDLVPVDAHDVIANAHEAPEKTQLDKGKVYAAAHNVNANTYESTFLREKYDVSHDDFNEALQPYLDRALKEGANAPDISPNLDPKPYVDDDIEHLLGPSPGKVVDADGKPLTVYHGTATDFDQFAPTHEGEATGHATSPLGHFFTPSRESAEGYARNASEGRPADERVIEAKLAIHNPYTMPLAESQSIATPEQGRAVRQQLEAAGYDGIHLPGQNAWVAFHPEQIHQAGPTGPERANAIEQLGVDVPHEDHAEALSLDDLVQQAMDAGVDSEAIRQATSTGTAADHAIRLWGLTQDAHTAEVPGDRGSVDQARPQGRTAVDGSRQGAESPGAAQPEATTEPERRAQPADDVTPPDIESLRHEIGWDQVGGRLLRATDEGGEKTEVTGRTGWVSKAGPNEETGFWGNRPAKGGKITEVGAHAAMDKAAAGDPLNAKEQRFIDYARTEAGNREDAYQSALKDFHDEANETDNQASNKALRDLNVPEDQLGDGLTVMQMVDRAFDAGVPAEEIQRAFWDGTPEAARRLFDLTRQQEQSNATTSEIPRGGEDGASASGARPAADHGNEPQGVQSADAGAETAGPSNERPAGSERPAGGVGGDLFGRATPAEELRAEQERRDAKRNGLGRDLVRPEQGAGDLLAGDKPQQTDVQDQPAKVARSEPTDDTTGIKHATVAEERALKGKDEVDYEGKRTFGDAWDTASDALAKDPAKGQDLAHAIIAKPRPLSAEESATLIQDRMRLKNGFREANADIAQAIDDKDPNAEATARVKLRTIEDALDINDQASKASGYEQGFGLAARRMMSRADYSMADMVTQAKAAAGRDLTPAERGQIERLSKMIEEKDAQIADLQKQRATRKAGTTGTARKTADQHFKDLSAQLKLIAQKDQLQPGCIV